MAELQWEFFFTCWRYNLDVFHHNRSWLKNPLWRLAHVPEPMLRSRLYLDLDSPATKFMVAQEVPVALAAASSREFTQIFQAADD